MLRVSIPENTRHLHETDIHTADWIRTHNPSKRAAAGISCVDCELILTGSRNCPVTDCEGMLRVSIPDNTRHLHETDIHTAGWIRTHNPSKRAAAGISCVECELILTGSRNCPVTDCEGMLRVSLPDNTRYLHETDIHTAGWIRTHNPSKRAAAGISSIFNLRNLL